MSQIKFNEKNFNKLLDQYDSWKERIIDSEDVRANFNTILQAIKKSGPNAAVKEKLPKFAAMIGADEERKEPSKE